MSELDAIRERHETDEKRASELMPVGWDHTDPHMMARWGLTVVSAGNGHIAHQDRASLLRMVDERDALVAGLERTVVDRETRYIKTRERQMSCAKALMKQKTLLRELEWSGVAEDGNDGWCPVCNGYQNIGHWDDCRLAALIGEKDE